MADPFTGEIRAFAFSYAPVDWAFCNGQQIAIQQNSVLYALIGNLYGTAPANFFLLPNLQAMTPMHVGLAPGGPGTVILGQQLGAKEITLQTSQIPGHTHQVNGGLAVSANMKASPENTSLLSRPFSTAGGGTTAYWAYSNLNTPNANMAPNMIQSVGQGQPHTNLQPYVTLNFCICLYGEYPVPED